MDIDQIRPTISIPDAKLLQSGIHKIVIYNTTSPDSVMSKEEATAFQILEVKLTELLVRADGRAAIRMINQYKPPVEPLS